MTATTREILHHIFPDLAFTGSCAQAITLARRGIFDLYLLDTCLPDASGIDLCRNIRLLDANTPVILLSAAGPMCSLPLSNVGIHGVAKVLYHSRDFDSHS